MNRIFIVVAVLLSFTVSNVSNAQIGSKAEVIEAAKAGKEPTYIKDLMARLSERLEALANAKDLHTSKARLAWLMTMEAILGVTLSAAAQESYYERSFTAGYIAHASTEMAFQNIASVMDSYQVRVAFSSVAGNELRSTVRNAASQVEVTQAASLYRVAEWTALNFLLENIDRIVNATFQVALDGLPDNPANNPVVNQETWITFYNQHFANLDSAAMCFLSPWFNVLTSSMFREHRAPNAFWSLSNYVSTNFDNFPRELVVFIMLLTAQAHVQVHK